MSRELKLVFSTFLVLLLAACSDPYEREIPPGYFTPGEAASIAESLSPQDKDAFLNWSKRMQTSDRYPGESSPPNIRSAILVQNNFVKFDAERQRQLSLQRSEVAKKQQQEDLRQQYQARKYLANQEISKILEVKITGYNREPIWSVTGRQIGWNWVFNLKIKNKGTKKIDAFKGTLKIGDSFGKYNNSMSGQVDLEVPPGKTVTYAVTYPNNDDSPLHNLMQRGQKINYSWVLDSVAFSDGTKLDPLSETL
jgi:hypothetical protein